MEEADRKINMALRSHALPLIRTCEPSLKQGELKTREGVQAENGRSWLGKP